MLTDLIVLMFILSTILVYHMSYARVSFVKLDCGHVLEGLIVAMHLKMKVLS
jgi:hypothetical protein